MNQNQTEPKPADAEQESGKGLDETPCSVLWLSLPDDIAKQDAPLIAALKNGDAWTTDMRQAARFAALGYTVKRRDRHLEGHLVETELSADVLDLSIDRGFEMRGERELNRPTADVWDETQRLRAALRECLDGIDYTLRADAILRPEERHIGLEKLNRHRSLLHNSQDR